MTKGSVIFAGSGILLGAQLTPEAQSAVAKSDIVLTLVGDPLVEAVIGSINGNVHSLDVHYGAATSRPAAYRAMVERILSLVRAGKKVCVILYGHPGVFVAPSHAAIAQARAEGFEAQMLPAISAEDCLISDLGVDPGATGMQTYEARDFFINARPIDPCAALVLWQIAVLGDGAFVDFISRPGPLLALSRVLQETYSADHEVIVYRAATLPTERARIERVTLSNLHSADVDQTSTLYVPPARAPAACEQRLALLAALAPAAGAS